MNKAELINAIANSLQEENGQALSKNQIASVVDSLGKTVQTELANGGEVTVPYIGRFFVGERAARTGRNPQTGEPLEIAAARVAKFKPLKAMKDAINS